MERVGGSVEFLCLYCGLQGLCNARCSQPVEEMFQVFCPRCGGRVLTPHFEKEKDSLMLTV